MEPLIEIVGAAASLPLNNVNTDTIAPTRPRAQAGPAAIAEREIDATALFAPLRYDAQGAPRADFVLNRPGFERATILLAGSNFGCGSSREQAVWLLADFGIRCVIAPSFGGIFYDSCFKNGILPVMLPADQIDLLIAEVGAGAPQSIFSVEVASGTITTPGGRKLAFDLPEFRRSALLSGLDDIALTLRGSDAIAQFQARDRAARPWIYLPMTKTP